VPNQFSWQQHDGHNIKGTLILLALILFSAANFAIQRHRLPRQDAQYPEKMGLLAVSGLA
jgi:hypothetical protein